MQPLTREQILTLIHTDPEAVAQLLEALFAEVHRLRERIKALENRLAQDSRANPKSWSKSVKGK